MSVNFLITTYQRKESCQRLVDSLHGLGKIIVVKDGHSYSIAGCDVFHEQDHRGKLGYWETVNTLFSLRGQADYYIMLPDDFLPKPNMINESLRIWDSIKDDAKICLNLYADRIGKPCWTRYPPVKLLYCYKTQWVDMCFFCKEEFFVLLREMPPTYISRRSSSRMSSGVGRYISNYYNEMGLGLYQVKESLVVPQPDHAISQMKKQ